MTTFNSKRFAKLAGIIKEASEAELLSAYRAEDADLNQQENEQEVRDIIRQMNAKAKEGLGPKDVVILLSADALIGSGINTREKLHKYFKDEEAREKFKQSLAGQWDDWDDFSDRLKTKENPGILNKEDEERDYSYLEKQLGGPGGKHGMGRPTMESKKSNKKVLSSSPVSISLKAAMKSCDHLNECGCQMEKAPFDAPEDEPQGYMLVQNLKKLAAKAAELSTMANHDDDAEPWVESKINSAAHHIDAIYDYIKYGRPSEEHMMHEPKSMPHDDFSDLDVHMANTYEENE